MDPGQTSTVRLPSAAEEIFAGALELPIGEREAFVRLRCDGDNALVQSVLALLARFDRLGSFLHSPAVSTASVEPSIHPGIVLAGRFRLFEQLGQGGMGVVYRADDLELGETIALKMVREMWLDDPAVLARFREEIRLARKIAQPNICRIYDLFTDTVGGRNRAFFTMEYLGGQSLAVLLRSGWRPEAQEICAIVRGIAAGLDAAHDAGVVHRDLKPANIVLVTASGGGLRPVVMDFGLAQAFANPGETVTQTGQIVGSPDYMAPEQFLGEHVTPAADVFSLAAIAYEMATGSRPWPGESLMRTALRRINSPVGVLNCGPKSPGHWNAVLENALARDPAARPQRAGDLLNRLEGYLPPKSGGRIWHFVPSRKSGAHGQTTAAADFPSIAVLPFANLSADKENEYFSDGLAEEILNLLSKISGLTVIARTSAFAFRGKDQDIRTIAETLGVRTVLEGSVRRAGSRIRVTAQLVEAENGSHLWAERYDRDLTDIFAIQDEIAQAISEALKVKLAPKAKTVNIEAWQNYLKGQYHRVRYTPDSLAKAKQCFEQALAIDPNYAPAYIGLAAYYYSLGVLGIRPTGEMAPLAKSAAEKALLLDPENCEAHSVLGGVAGADDYDWLKAQTHFRQALATETVPPMVRYRYVMYYLWPLGRFSEAIEQSRLALETDPLSTVLHQCLASSMNNAKQYREAMDYATRALEIDSTFFLMWATLGIAQLSAGLAQEAIASLKRCVALAPWWHVGMGLLAAVCLRAGDPEDRREWSEKLAGPDGSPTGRAIWYAATGEVEAMFEALNGACIKRDATLLLFQNLPFFDSYRADPRFQSLLARMNLA